VYLSNCAADCMQDVGTQERRFDWEGLEVCGGETFLGHGFGVCE
jgi:hypothetical protein